MKTVLVDRSIPVAEWQNPDHGPGRPLVLLFHWLGGTKEMMAEYAARFTAQGYFVAAPDARLHGDRRPSSITGNADYLALDPAEFFAVHAGTAGEIGRILDHYRDDPRVDTGRTGLLGFSLGGMIVHKHAAEAADGRVRAAVPALATPRWRAYVDHNRARFTHPRYGTAEGLGAVEALEPVRRPGRPDLPLLMLHGADDPVIPAAGVRQAHEAIRSGYADPALAELRVFPGTGHEVSDPLLEAAGDWFRKFL